MPDTRLDLRRAGFDGAEFGAGGPAFSSEGISKTDSAWKEKGGKPRARRPIAGFEVKIT